MGKKLNQNKIEKLGWIYLADAEFDNGIIYNLYTYNEYLMGYYKGKMRIQYLSVDPKTPESVLFNGVCKTSQDLVTLMYLVEIYKEQE